MSRVAGRIAELRVALMLMTRLPVRRVRDPVPELHDARWAFPLAGLPLGLAAWAVHAGLLGLGASTALAAGAALLTLVLLTGGLHFDGLADCADGAGAGPDRARRLEIMRDSRIGSYGVLALILTLGLWWAALAQTGHDAGLLAFLGLAVASRVALLAVLCALPPAREDGLGAAAARNGDAGATHGWGALLPSAALALVALALLGWAGVVAALGVAAAATTLALWARHRLGGQTGDVLGAVQVLGETAGWVALALTAG
jgi:adenosylcobinamide-GDP ribazoletransferase